MTDFNEGHIRRCNVCGEKFLDVEGKDCDCWKCNECGEEFSDFDMLGNRELFLCLYCEDKKYQAEIGYE